MIYYLVILWLLVFFIFLAVSIAADSSILGIISGIWLLLLGLAIIVSGIQVQSGMEINMDGSTTTYEYQYDDATLPYSTYSFVWGIILILSSMYIVYANGENIA